MLTKIRFIELHSYIPLIMYHSAIAEVKPNARYASYNTCESSTMYHIDTNVNFPVILEPIFPTTINNYQHELSTFLYFNHSIYSKTHTPTRPTPMPNFKIHASPPHLLRLLNRDWREELRASCVTERRRLEKRREEMVYLNALRIRSRKGRRGEGGGGGEGEGDGGRDVGGMGGGKEEE